LKLILKITFIFIQAITFAACANNAHIKPQFEVDTSGVIHVPFAKSEVKYRGETYKVLGAIEENKIGKEIGTTEETLRVFEIKGVAPESEISILVRSGNPIIYFKASK
jgi:hypothetical protein